MQGLTRMLLDLEFGVNNHQPKGVLTAAHQITSSSLLTSPFSPKSRSTMGDNTVAKDLLKKMAAELKAEDANEAKQAQNEKLAAIMTWSLRQVLDHVVETGQFKGRRFEEALKDKSYRKWIIDNASRLKADGMMNLVACYRRHQQLTQQVKSRTEGPASSAEYPSKAKGEVNLGGKSRNPDDRQGQESYEDAEMEMRAWTRVDEELEGEIMSVRSQVIQVEDQMGTLNQRMDSMEVVLKAILQEIQMQRTPTGV